MIDFPINAFPSEWEAIIKKVNEAGLPAGYVGGGMLFAVSAALTNKIRVNIGNKQGNSGLFICLLGASGAGKTPAASLMINPIRDKLIQDVTYRWLRDEGVFRKDGLALYNDQFICNLVKTKNLQIYNSILGAADNTSEHQFITIGGTAVEKDIKNLINRLTEKYAVTDSFFRKIIYCYPENMQANCFTSVEQISHIEVYEEYIKNIRQINKPKTIGYSEDAKEVFFTNYNKLGTLINEANPYTSGNLASYLSFYRNHYFLAFSIILQTMEYAVSKNEDDLRQIGINAAQGAAALCNYFSFTAQKFTAKTL